MKVTRIIANTAFTCLAWASFASAQDQFVLSSTTFENNGFLPISAIYNYPVNGVNVCSVDGSAGGDESPELSWANTPRGTRSFAVTVFDATAGVTHWGMYNIAGTATGLPENAGVTGSSYGPQVINTYGYAGSNAEINYGGPCPPSFYPPNVHHYVFTVYALDIDLSLPASADFPPTALTLVSALAAAGSSGHILGSASIVGLYTTTPTSK